MMELWIPVSSSSYPSFWRESEESKGGRVTASLNSDDCNSEILDARKDIFS
jgi:hypothetical protein